MISVVDYRLVSVKEIEFILYVSIQDTLATAIVATAAKVRFVISQYRHNDYNYDYDYEYNYCYCWYRLLAQHPIMPRSSDNSVKRGVGGEE